MNRGRSQNSGGGGRGRGRGRFSRSTADYYSASPSPHSPVGSDGSTPDTPLDRMDKVTHIGWQTSEQRSSGSISKPKPFSAVKDISSDIGNLKLAENSSGSVGHNSKQIDGMSTSGSKLKKDFSSFSAQSDPTDTHPNVRNTQMWQISGGGSESHSTVHVASSSVFDTAQVKDGSSLPAGHAINEMPSNKETESSQSSHEKTGSTGISDNSDGTPVRLPFDIFQERTGSVVKLKPPLLVKNREKRKEISRAVEGFKISVLRSGMILLKNYISCVEQVKILKTCRDLGLGQGGFYQPGYRDGAELHLKMMCLGKNWDPETSRYVELRPIDLARPPVIPNEFLQLVKGAIQDTHEYLQKQTKERSVEYILPSMSPNLCIVNFYANSGRLGLHQDKDESQESIGRGLPVVSFSIGDSAEFLYSDQRDVDKAEKVILESGDVLIFGGKSRRIFHGVKKILQDTAPKALREESNIRPGRLNLTFREY